MLGSLGAVIAVSDNYEMLEWTQYGIMSKSPLAGVVRIITEVVTVQRFRL